MKKMGILVLIYVVGGISGAAYHSMTTGAVDRARIAAAVADHAARNGMHVGEFDGDGGK